MFCFTKQTSVYCTKSFFRLPYLHTIRFSLFQLHHGGFEGYQKCKICTKPGKKCRKYTKQLAEKADLQITHNSRFNDLPINMKSSYAHVEHFDHNHVSRVRKLPLSRLTQRGWETLKRKRPKFQYSDLFEIDAISISLSLYNCEIAYLSRSGILFNSN